MLTGGLLVDKPAGLTSHDVVARVRRLTEQRRVGHSGTLDPFATGLLVLALGRATRLARFVSGVRKSYLATVRFGFGTDTFDRTGIPEPEPRGDPPSREDLEASLASFLGPQLQLPPPFSAKKVEGERAYRLARAGVSVRLGPVPIEIHELGLVDYSAPRAVVEVTVSSGAYIRRLADDLGRRLGCGGHVEELRRTRVGSFGVDEATTLEALSACAAEGRIPELLLSPAEMLRDLPVEILGPGDAARFVHGRSVALRAAPSALLRVLALDGELLGVAESDALGKSLRPVVVWAGAA